MMTPAVRVFIYSVIVADLFAVVYFGGKLALTGSILPHAEHAQIVVPGAEEAHADGGAPKAEEPAFDLASYTPDPVKGQAVAGKCKACHTFENGGPNRVGPNLWGIYGAPAMHTAGFAYSGAMEAKKAEIGSWDETKLHAFVESPKEYVPGTKMQFNGVKNPKERADLIAWLKTLK